MPRGKSQPKPVVREPAPQYRECDVRALMAEGHDAAVATYRAWVAYRRACHAYAARTGMPDPADDVSGIPMAAMHKAVSGS